MPHAPSAARAAEPQLHLNPGSDAAPPSFIIHALRAAATSRARRNPRPGFRAVIKARGRVAHSGAASLVVQRPAAAAGVSLRLDSRRRQATWPSACARGHHAQRVDCVDSEEPAPARRHGVRWHGAHTRCDLSMTSESFHFFYFASTPSTIFSYCEPARFPRAASFCTALCRRLRVSLCTWPLHLPSPSTWVRSLAPSAKGKADKHAVTAAERVARRARDERIAPRAHFSLQQLRCGFNIKSNTK